MCYNSIIEREVMNMFKVYNELGFVIMETNNEEEADFFAWLHNGYYI